MFNLFKIFFPSESETSIDISNNAILRDASGNIITIPAVNLNAVGGGGGGFNPLNALALLSPIDEHGNRVRKR
jgi:hypothetical protein